MDYHVINGKGEHISVNSRTSDFANFSSVTTALNTLSVLMIFKYFPYQLPNKVYLIFLRVTN